MKILKIITTILSILTGVYILHSIILPAIFKEKYIMYISDIADRISNILNPSDFSSTIMIHVDDKTSVWQMVLSTILPIIMFFIFSGLTVWLHIKVKKIKK